MKLNGNKQKRKYISALLSAQSTPFIFELDKRFSFLNSTPSHLYKYRPCDKHTIDMLANSYCYLAPAGKLDDPFDCFNESGLVKYCDIKTKRLTKKGISFIVDCVYPGFEALGMDKRVFKEKVFSSITEEGIELGDWLESGNYSSLAGPSLDQAFIILLKTVGANSKSVFQELEWDGFFANALFPSERVGVCSFSELRDNKPMWSLYGKNYEGCCLEYEVPRAKTAWENLVPVIYTRHPRNNLAEQLLRYAISGFLRSISGGRFGDDLGAAMELFCTKDSDWSFQREWRQIGKANGRFTGFNLKAVYLGFKVKSFYERRIVKLAREHGFQVFKMNPPGRTSGVTYKRII